MEKVKEATLKPMVADKETAKEIITNETLANLQMSLTNLTAVAGKVPFKVAYAIERNNDRIMSVLRRFDTKRLDIIKEHAKMTKDGQFEKTQPTQEEIANGARPEIIYKSKEAEEKCKKELMELVNSEAEKVEFYKINFSDIESISIDLNRVNYFDLFIKYIINENN